MKKILSVLVLLFAAGLVSCGDDKDSPSAPAVQKTLFTVVDSTESYTKVCFKGTFSEWKLLQMYDDGTNGDVTAGDHTWSIELAVTEDGTWGAVEDDGTANGIWLLASGDSNREYTVAADGTVAGQVSYTIPTPAFTATITFTVDDSANKTLTDVKFNGSGIGWSPKAMYDDGTNGDVTAGDNIWTLTTAVSDTAAEGSWGFIYGADGTWGLPAGTSNLTYTIGSDGSVTGTTSYTVE